MASHNYVLFDGEDRAALLPFAFTRALCDFRCGILTIREKWNRIYSTDCGVLAYPYLQPKYSYSQTTSTIFINGSLFPDTRLAEAINTLQPGCSLVNQQDQLLAVRPDKPISTLNHLYLCGKALKKIKFEHPTQIIKNNWDIFTLNGAQIEADVALMKLEANGSILESSNHLKNPEKIYVAEGAEVSFSILNASAGSIYLGPDSEVMEGCIVKGPFALGEHAALKMGAKVYGDTTVGPYSKVGGEVSNSVIFGYTNKGHDGFLGNSVLGEWCNLGADTNNSNLKNNYSSVKVWSYAASKEIDTGLQFCGLMMGDHSKCGINTMFNTGTVVGVSANIYGGGFPPKFIPSFCWGGADGMVEYELEKAMDTASKVMARRKMELSDIDKQILWQVFEDSSAFRTLAMEKKL